MRCYAAAAIWVPTISGVLLGNVSIPLAFALAVVWRYRDVRPASGHRAGARRVGEAAALADASSGCSPRAGFAPLRSRSPSERRSPLVAWAVIGFAGLGEYPDLLRRLSEIQSERSYSIVGMAATLGAGRGSRPRRDARRRWRAARRVRPPRAPRRRGAVVHVRGRGDARAEPDRLAPLPRPAARAARDPATAVLAPLAAARAALGEPAPGLRGGVRDVHARRSWR